MTVNDRSYTLNQAPISVVTDANGRITIVQEVTDALSSPTYTVHLPSTDPNTPPAAIIVNPAQRVIQQLSKYTTATSIANAKTTDGRKVQFGNSANKDSFGAAAELLGQFAPMLHSVDSDAGKQLVPRSKQLTEGTTHVAGRDVSQDSEAAGWFLNAAHSAAEFFGDVWETIKGALKSAFKFVVRVAGKVITLVVSIAGKIFSFVVNAVAPLVRV